MNASYDKKSIILKDKLFKYIFSNRDIAQDLIKSIFNYLEINECNKIKKIDTQKLLPSNKKSTKDYYGDLVFTLENNNIISLEAYKNFGIKSYKKSLNYITRIYSSQLEEGENNYEKAHKVYSINIVTNFKEEGLINRYMLKNKITNKELFEGDIQMIFINLEKNRGIKEDIKRLERWMSWMRENDENKREEIVKEDEVMTMAERAVKRFFDSLPYETEEEYDAWRKEFDIECAKDVGREEGEEKKTEEIAINLLKDNIPVAIVQKNCNLTEEEIMELIKNHNIKI